MIYIKTNFLKLKSNPLIFLILIIKINFSLYKSFDLYVDSEQKISLSLLQGECTLIPCGNSFCSIVGGICEKGSEGKICKCQKDFTTPKEDEFYNCCYKQKSSVKAFFLEACFLFGLGHFYVGNKKLGFIKVIVYTILLVPTILIILRRLYQKQRFIFDRNIIIKMFKTLWVLICGCTIIIWQMIDSVLFCLGGYTDNNGVKLS